MIGISLFHWIILALLSGIFIIPAWRIVSRLGYPGALSLLLLVPGINVIVLWLFAFSRWPIDKVRP